MLELEPSPAARTPDVYLLFAHEPYYPGPGSREINTTVVAADSLLHPLSSAPARTATSAPTAPPTVTSSHTGPPSAPRCWTRSIPSSPAL
ncbi:hypothetical protein ACFQ0G_43430 [Streptomyces chiangmaiensis]